MPSIAFLSDGTLALSLWSLTHELKGDESQFRARDRVRTKITAIWPELLAIGLTESEEVERQAKLKESRGVEINPTEQTALAEGFLKRLQDQEMVDAGKTQILKLAKLCKFSKWLDTQIDKKTLREFAESDEEVKADPEDKAEK